MIAEDHELRYAEVVAEIGAAPEGKLESYYFANTNQKGRAVRRAQCRDGEAVAPRDLHRSPRVPALVAAPRDRARRSRARSAIRIFGLAAKDVVLDQPRPGRGPRGRARLARQLRSADAARGRARDAGDGRAAFDPRAAVDQLLHGVAGAQLSDRRIVLALPAREVRPREAARALSQRRRFRRRLRRIAQRARDSSGAT